MPGRRRLCSLWPGPLRHQRTGCISVWSCPPGQQDVQHYTCPTCAWEDWATQEHNPGRLDCFTLGTVHKWCQPYWEGVSILPPRLSAIVSNWLTPLPSPLCQQCQHLATNPSPPLSPVFIVSSRQWRGGPWSRLDQLPGLFSGQTELPVWLSDGYRPSLGCCP